MNAIIGILIAVFLFMGQGMAVALQEFIAGIVPTAGG